MVVANSDFEREQQRQQQERTTAEATNIQVETQQKCLARGGVWDEATRTCKIDKGEPGKARTTQQIAADMGISLEELKERQDAFSAEVEAKKKDPRQQDVFRDEGTGELTGFQRNGTTFLGASPQTVRQEAEGQAEKKELVAGGSAEAAQRGVTERARQGLDLSAQVGQDPMQQLESEFSAQGVSYVAAIASGVPGIFSDVIAGATTGAGAALVAGQLGPQVATPEEIVTVPTAALIGGIGNAVRGFYSDFVASVKRQKTATIETPIRTLTETKSIMNDIISGQNANPAEAAANLEAFNSQLQLLDDEYDRLKSLTDDDLNMFLGVNGINQMQEYEVYYVPNGERDRQIREFQLALANPDPSNVRVGGDTLKQLNKRIDREVKKLQGQQ